MFYSEECRIRYEFDRFFRSMRQILCRSMLICIYLDDRICMINSSFCMINSSFSLIQ